MKVYTEVNYIWKDNKLVQTDSKFYDYEGEVDLCHWYHRHSTTVKIPSVTPKITIPTVTLPKVTLPKVKIPTKIKIPTINEVKEVVSKGPTGGTPKDVADALYGGSTKDAVENVQETYVAAENSYNETKDDVVEALFAPVKKKLEETATSLINEKRPTSNVNTQEDDLLYGSRRGIQMQDEGQRASTGGLRRTIHELKTLSGKAKPKG
jgi:hypothetical protein